MISSPGLGSGLDVSSIVRQLVSLERQPIDALQTKQSEYRSQISSYGRLKSALSNFQSSMDNLKALRNFEVYTGVSSDTDSLTAETSISASEGSFSVNITNLAVAHKMGSAAFADTGTTTIGNAGDTMDITINGQTLSVDYGGMTLGQIRDAINSAANADPNVDLTASIISENATSHRLVLTSGNTGTDYTINPTFKDSGGGAIADPLTLGTIVPAENASVTIDNTYTITRNSNSIDDAIDGVTLNLAKVTASPVTLDINRDTQAVKDNVKTFVEAYNSLKNTFSSLRQGNLEGDSTIRTIESQIRSALNTAPTGLTTSLEYLAQVGVEIQREGNMTLDESKLEDAMASDFEGVAQLFANDNQGYVYRMESLVNDLLDIEGFVKSREDGLQSRIDTIDSRVSRMEYRLGLYEDGLRAQFTNLDVMMAQMQQTSTFLANQLF